MRLEFIRKDGTHHYCFFFYGCKDAFIERVERLMNVKFAGVVE